MPLEDLLNAIESEADEERARLGEEAEAEAAAILSRAREEAARAREDVLRSRVPAAEAEANRRRAVARLEAGRLEREARHEAFVLLLAETCDRLAKVRGEPGHRDALRALLREALAALPDAATARVHPDDEGLADRLAREAGANLVVTPDPGVDGGLVLEAAGGRVVRNTFGARLANAEARLRPWYGRRLEALGSPEGAR
ncbi:hypothetical protein AVDCRST_MAG82-2492 [uncultured Rubrobacteraceae bacterium]|uniref:V-type proton ATPase subunit E n=1 Tax=uncultured Rubrobacteraceae bacterium TaxID=349277 RepID=A0A6J4QCC2_9ACTN|nr:hypothetical protein AVDCRST_MAG82-2492 [uncultured Rubrobacteraceae bacterium]